MSTTPEDSDERAIEIQVRWGDDSELTTIYANNLFISHAGAQFYLIFGELMKPLIMDVEGEKDRVPSHLTVKPVAKIAVSPEVMELMVKAINDNVEKFREQQQRQKK
jgi:hypothetical protein